MGFPLPYSQILRVGCTQAEETDSNGALGGFLELLTFGQGLIGYIKLVLAVLSL